MKHLHIIPYNHPLLNIIVVGDRCRICKFKYIVRQSFVFRSFFLSSFLTISTLLIIKVLDYSTTTYKSIDKENTSFWNSKKLMSEFENLVHVWVEILILVLKRRTRNNIPPWLHLVGNKNWFNNQLIYSPLLQCCATDENTV